MSAIFNAANELKIYEVTIGGTKFTKELVLSFEMVYECHTPVIKGELLFKDLYDMNDQIDWNEAEVEVKFLDIFDQEVKRNFKILSIDEYLDEMFEKHTTLKLQDVVSYKISRCVKSKSFTGNIVTCLNAYLDDLKITEIERDFTNSDKEVNFVVPQNVNHLEWLMFELKKYGFTLYQSKTKIHLKSIADIVPSALPVNDQDKYLSGTDNQLYKNKIYELKPVFKNRTKTPRKIRAMAYDPLQKKMVTNVELGVELNKVEEYSLNSDKFNLQDFEGEFDVYQTHLDFNETKMLNRDQFIDQQEMEIIVNGYVKNDVLQIYDLELVGIKASAPAQTKGNVIVGGKWMSTKVVDKIVYDNMVQKIILKRADMVVK